MGRWAPDSNGISDADIEELRLIEVELRAANPERPIDKETKRQLKRGGMVRIPSDSPFAIRI